jgi:endonuclease G
MPLDRPASYNRAHVESALRTWKATRKERERAKARIDDGRPLDAEKPERVEKYARRLLKNLANIAPKDQPSLPGTLRGAVAEARTGAPVPVERMRRAALERMIGEAEEYLPVMFISRAAMVLRSVGRIIDRRQQFGFGTGFLVAPGVLMTNNHVLRNEAEAEASSVQFRYELDLGLLEIKPVEFRLEPERLFLTDPELDFSLVAVRPSAEDGTALDDFGYLPLVGAQGKIRVGQPVNIIQHPEGERKQVIFRESTLSLLPEQPGHVAHYTGDTKPGSSGSPVFSDAWEVVALHHSGVPATNANDEWLDRDGNVWDENQDPDMRTVKWIANEGIRVSTLVRRIGEFPDGDPAGRGRELLASVLQIGEEADANGVFSPRPAPAGRESAVRPVPQRPAPAPAAAASLQVPLTITVSLGAGGVELQAGLERGLPRRQATDYVDRKGFDRDFLGPRVEMPAPQNTIAGNLATLNGSTETELKYDHFSVLMNRSRRLAYVSAGNLRIDAPFNADREDPWGYDPRLPEALQAGNEFYSRNDLDRGHLFRRADGAWGETADEAARANDDTCHWTNIAPQHFVFNQSGQDDELSLWGLLENHVAAEATRERQRVNVFNGPIFTDDDPPHRGLLVPMAYWKVLSICDPSGAQRAFAFVVGQERLLQNLPTEAFGAGRFAIYQVKLRDLEMRTGLDFGALRTADVMEAAGAEALFERGAPRVRIGRLSDVVRARR